MDPVGENIQIYSAKEEVCGMRAKILKILFCAKASHISAALAALVYFGIYAWLANSNIRYVPLFELEALISLLFRFRLFLVWVLNIPRLANAVSTVYGFETIFDFAYNATQNYDLGFDGYIYAGLAITLFFAANLLIAINAISQNSAKFAFYPIMAFFIIGLHQAESLITTNYNIVGFPLLNYVSQYKNFNTHSPRFYKTEPVIDLKNIDNKNIYYFLLESHTKLNSEELSSAIYAGINFPYERKKIKADFGSTFRGELRELCGLISYPDVSSGAIPPDTNCLPRTLSATHRTIAIHGGVKGMYKRNTVYPVMGFGEYYSLQDLGSVESCGGGWKNFPCDIGVLKFYEEAIKDKRNVFAYFLTINTHNPYTPTSYASPVCPELITSDVDMCNHFRNVAGLMVHISDFAKRNPGIYILSGDHPPPMLKKYYSSEHYDRIIFESL